MKKISIILIFIFISLFDASANRTYWSKYDDKTGVTFSMVVTIDLNATDRNFVNAYVHDSSIQGVGGQHTLYDHEKLPDYADVPYGHQFNSEGKYWVYYQIEKAHFGEVEYLEKYNEVRFSSEYIGLFEDDSDRTIITLHYYPVTAYSNSNVGSVKVSSYNGDRGYMSNSTKTRNLNILVDNVLVQSSSYLCPSTFPDNADKLVVDAKEGYRVSKAYDSNTQTFTVEYLSEYKVSFNGNGATSGTMADQSFVWDTEQNLTENAYKKEYTVTFDGNGGTPAASSLTSSASFSGWEDRSTFVYPDDGSTWTCLQFDAPFYANFYSLKTYFGYNKYKLLNHYITYGQGEGRQGVGDTPGVYSDKELVGNLSSTGGGVVPLYAVWAPQPAVTLPSATRTGYVFEGWYTSATGGTKIGDAGGSFTPIENSTLYGHWSLAVADLTINETGLAGKDGIIVTVTVSGSAAPVYVVSLDADTPSVTIKSIPFGTYVIAETGWSHAYTVDQVSYEKNISGNTEVTFAHTSKSTTPLHAEKSVTNWKSDN